MNRTHDELKGIFRTFLYEALLTEARKKLKIRAGGNISLKPCTTTTSREIENGSCEHLNCIDASGNTVYHETYERQAIQNGKQVKVEACRRERAHDDQAQSYCVKQATLDPQTQEPLCNEYDTLNKTYIPYEVEGPVSNSDGTQTLEWCCMRAASEIIDKDESFEALLDQEDPLKKRAQMISAYTKRIDDLAVKLKKYEKLFEDFETATMVGGINKHGNIVYYNQKTLQRKIDSVQKKMVTSAKQMEKELQSMPFSTNESLNAYIQENQKNIQTSIATIKEDLDRDSVKLSENASPSERESNFVRILKNIFHGLVSGPFNTLFGPIISYLFPKKLKGGGGYFFDPNKTCYLGSFFEKFGSWKPTLCFIMTTGLLIAGVYLVCNITSDHTEGFGTY